MASAAGKGKHQKKGRQNAFLQAFSECGVICGAADTAGINRNLHYKWLTEDDDYRENFELAKAQANDLLEQEARRRAVDGVDEPVGWYQGEPGGTIRRYSDTLLIFLMKGAMPEKYRERYELPEKNDATALAQQLRDFLAATSLLTDAAGPDEKSDADNTQMD